MVLDFGDVIPNVARDRSIKLPREEPEEVSPPTADHVEAVYRLLPAHYRLRTAIGRACRATGTPLWSPHDLRHRRDLAPSPARRPVGADRGVRRSALVESHRRHLHHVLMDERELDYPELLAEAA
jgi:hypothetical protein